jgi:hypothetical protein
MVAANRELLALSAANAGLSLMHGFPVSSSSSRTAIGLATGSRSQLYSVTAAVAVVVVLLFARPVLAHFPTAALGAIVIYAALRLIDVTAFRRLFAFRRTELAIALATCLAVLGLNILYGVLVAIGLSVADLLVRVARPHDAILGLVPGLAGMHDVDDYPGAQTIPGLVVCTATTRRCSSPTPATSTRALAASSQGPGSPPLVRAQRRSERRGRLHRLGGPRCGPRGNHPGKAPSSLSPASNRIYSPGYDPSAWRTRSAKNGSSPPSPQRSRPIRHGPGSTAIAPRGANTRTGC